MSLAVERATSGQTTRLHLNAVAGAHELAALRGDAGAQQEPVETNAFVAKRVAFVDADHHWRQAFDIFALCEARLGERVASVKGVKSIGHGAAVVLHRDEDALVLGRRWVLRLRPLPGDEGAHAYMPLIRPSSPSRFSFMPTARRDCRLRFPR
jgi:hypothetical protein